MAEVVFKIELDDVTAQNAPLQPIPPSPTGFQQPNQNTPAPAPVPAQTSTPTTLEKPDQTKPSGERSLRELSDEYSAANLSRNQKLNAQKREANTMNTQRAKDARMAKKRYRVSRARDRAIPTLKRYVPTLQAARDPAQMYKTDSLGRERPYTPTLEGADEEKDKPNKFNIQGLISALGKGNVPGALSQAGGMVGGAAGAEVAAAAGPVGAALLVAELAAQKLAKGFDNAAADVKLLGDMAALSASNNYLGMFNRGIQESQEYLKSFPIIGQVWSSELGLAVAPVKAFTEVVGAFVARGKELSNYSGDLAGANARVEVRDLLADFREADALGPDLARLTDAQDEFWIQMRDLILPLKKVVVEDLADFLEWLPGFFRELYAEGAAWGTGASILLETIAKATTGSPFEAVKELSTLNATVAGVYELYRQSKEDDEIGDFDQVADLIKGNRGIKKAGSVPLNNTFASDPLLGGF